MRLICALILLCALSPRALPAAPPEDVVVIVDISGLDSESAADEPWLCAPCINPEHCYLRPSRVRDTAETYRAAEGGGHTEDEYRFERAFIFEEAARGWRPWEEHFEKLPCGGYARVTGESDCLFARDLCVENACALMTELIARAPSCRVALCEAGERFDERFCVNFTGDEQKLCSGLLAAPASAAADFETALRKASEYISRRNADARRARSVGVIIVTANKDAADEYAGCALIFDVLEDDVEAFLTRLFPPAAAQARGALRPWPTCPAGE